MIETEWCECGHALDEHSAFGCLGLHEVSPGYGERVYTDICYCLVFKLWYVA
jgi:hypothetical protein